MFNFLRAPKEIEGLRSVNAMLFSQIASIEKSLKDVRGQLLALEVRTRKPNECGHYKYSEWDFIAFAGIKFRRCLTKGCNHLQFENADNPFLTDTTRVNWGTDE